MTKWSRPFPSDRPDQSFRKTGLPPLGPCEAFSPCRRDRTWRLIPVSGYYEWQDTPTGKQPYYFTARDGSPALTIAGLWDEWQDRVSGETLKSCAMIITEPNKFVAEVHDRMPVLLAEKDFEPWLSGKAGLELLKPAPNDLLQKWPVSKRVNSSRASDDDPTLIEEITMAS
jgi:putative SOS response-associated peptidase YedK